MSNEQHAGKKKYKALLVGYLLIWGGYFAFKGVQFLTMETARGTIGKISQREFLLGTKRGTDIMGSYMYFEIHFEYQHSGDNSIMLYKVWAEPLSFKSYKRGDNIDVIFPKGNPELAQVYSTGEFWFATPYMIILGLACVVWLMIYALVVFKPWER